VKSLWNLGGLTPRQLTRNVVSEIRANNFFGRASELAFDFLFALFPLILFMLTLFGIFASHSLELQNDFLSYFAEFVPPMAFQLLKETTAELGANAGGGKLTFGILAALWFASGREFDDFQPEPSLWRPEGSLLAEDANCCIRIDPNDFDFPFSGLIRSAGEW